MRIRVVSLSVAAILGAILAPGTANAARPPTKPAPATVEVQLLAINDFHGNLEATPGPVLAVSVTVERPRGSGA